MTHFKRLIASLLIISSILGFPLTAQASIITTDEALSTEVTGANRDRVSTFLARADVRDALQAQGVNPELALDRVKAMSDVEVAQLAGRIDQAPAGGDILGILFTVFIVLLVTDILGLTKVFPFTRSVR